MFFQSYNVAKPNPAELVVVKSKLHAASLFIFSIAFYIVWYSSLLDIFNGEENFDLIGKIQKLVSNNPFMWLFVLGPLTAIPQILIFVKEMLFGTKIHFNGSRSLILKNGWRLAHFSEIDNIKIKTYKGSEDRSESYGLHLGLKNGKRIKIISTSKFEEVCDLADEIAQVTKSEVVNELRENASASLEMQKAKEKAELVDKEERRQNILKSTLPAEMKKQLLKNLE